MITYPGWGLPPNYVGLIYAKWLRSLRFGNEYFKEIDSDAYYSSYGAFIKRLMADKETLVRLAVLTDDHDVVLGFSVSRDKVLDYVHVHRDFRRIGIGKKLVPIYAEIFTHLTKTWWPIWKKCYPSMKFNPFV